MNFFKILSLIIIIIVYCVESKIINGNTISATELKSSLKDRIDILYYGEQKMNTTADEMEQAIYFVRHPYFGILPEEVKLRLYNIVHLLSSLFQVTVDINVMHLKFVNQEQQHENEACGTVYYFKGEPYLIIRNLENENSFVQNRLFMEPLLEKDIQDNCMFKMKSLDDIPTQIYSFFEIKTIIEPILIVLGSLHLGADVVCNLPNAIHNVFS